MDHTNGSAELETHDMGPDASVATLVPPDRNGATGSVADADAAAPVTNPSQDGVTATSTFLEELARAMQAAADRERARLTEVITGDAAATIEQARTRASTESDELRRLAEEDIDAIGAWLKTRTEQLRREATRRTDERRTRLGQHLGQYGSIIEAEIAGVEAAVNDYQGTLDTFFAELHGSADPSEIAGKAGLFPTPPDLDAARAEARATAVAQFAEDVGAASDESGDAGDADDAGSGPPDVLHAVEVAPEGSSEAGADSAPDQPGAAVRLLRSILERTAIL